MRATVGLNLKIDFRMKKAALLMVVLVVTVVLFSSCRSIQDCPAYHSKAQTEQLILA